MTSKLRSFALSAVTAGAIATAAGGPAAALTFEDISGRWCGSASSYTFAPGKMTVLLHADNAQYEYKINDYAYDDDTITVNWVRDGEKLFTKFIEFSRDGRSMAQQQNNAGPRREFKRCS